MYIIHRRESGICTELTAQLVPPGDRPLKFPRSPKRDYGRKGITLATTDATIAAVALYHELTLMTDNLKHYPMKELDLYPLPKN